MMKIIISFILCNIAFVTKAESIDSLIAQTYKYLAVYKALSPFSSDYSIKDFDFSEQELESINIENDSIYVHDDEIKYYERTGGDINTFFASDGYDSIDTIQTGRGVKYLLRGSVITCNTCYRQYITLVGFENEHPVCDFFYVLDTRFWWGDDKENTIDYDEATRTITVEYKTDDLTWYCNCESECYKDYSYDEDEFQKYCRCMFVFNGETFELVEQKRENKD